MPKQNTPTVKVILRGDYYRPHVVIQIGNAKTAAHTEPYANRSNGRRSWNTWAKVLNNPSKYAVVQVDETVRYL